MAFGLSPEVESRLDHLVGAAVERLKRWDCICRPLEPAASA
jgi:hypothetical protein